MCIRSTVSLRISVLYTVLEPPDLSNFRGILVSPYLILHPIYREKVYQSI